MDEMNVALASRYLLREAERQNYRDKVSRYLKIVGPRQSDYHDERSLFIKMAAYNVKLANEITAILLRYGENINDANIFGKTALHIALEHVSCNPTMVQLLLENGADPNIVNISNSTPLHYAVQNGNCSVRVIELLLANGATIDALNDLGDTPLLRALRNSKCSTDVIACLLEHGADITITNNYGRTSLHTAVANFDCSPKTIELLLNKGAPINVLNQNGRSPLFRAIESFCEPEVVRLMLDRGADMFYGESAFEKAVSCFNNECHCYKNCEGICKERSILLLILLIKFAYLLDLHFDVNEYILLLPDYQQLSEVAALFQSEAQAMDLQLIAAETTLREFLSGRKQVRFYPSDEAGGELCNIHTLLHFLEWHCFPMYGEIIISKLRMEAIRYNFNFILTDSEGNTMKVDRHATALALQYSDNEDVMNLALAYHSAKICKLCRQKLK